MIPLTGRLPAPKMTAYASLKDSIAYFGPARSGKTNALTRLALDLPGGLFATSTRPGLATDTMIARARRGPIFMADPAGDAGFGSNLFCSPLVGCRHPRTAIDSAGELMQAAPKDPGGSAAWIDKQSARLLRYLMHAAAWEPGASMLDVADWATDPDTLFYVARLLDHCPGARREWAVKLATFALTAESDPEFFNGAAAGVTTALEWLDDPAMEKIAGGAPGEPGEFDPVRFLLGDGRNEGPGTAYLIATDSAHNPVSPYFAWLLSYVFKTGKRLAATMPGKRLDPACALLLDEPGASCKAPVDRMILESAGWGFPFVLGLQSYSQLPEIWGEKAALTISNNLTWQVYLGGIKEPEHLDRASRMGRSEETCETSREGGVKSRRMVERPAFSPERIAGLQLGEALVVPRACRSFVGTIPNAEDHPLFEQATPAMFPDLTADADAAEQRRLSRARHRDPITTKAMPLMLTAVPVPQSIPGHLQAAVCGPSSTAATPIRVAATKPTQPRKQLEEATYAA